MITKLKSNIMFHKMLKRPDIKKAYAMVKPSDSWYDTITKVHNALREIQERPHEVLTLTAHDAVRLKGIYYPGDGSSNVTVVCIHGYTSHAEREWAFPGLFYLSLGYNVLIPYQRAHGISGGKRITLGALEHRDMLGWISRINERNPDDRIIIHGLSMGGGIALDLTAKGMKNVKAIISDAPSESIRGVFENTASYVFKEDGKEIAARAIARFEDEYGVDIDDFDRVKTVESCKYPLLLSAGSAENREELFEELKRRNPQPTEIIILPGCHHGNGMYKQTELYQKAIRDFIAGAIDN